MSVPPVPPRLSRWDSYRPRSYRACPTPHLSTLFAHVRVVPADVRVMRAACACARVYVSY
nr:MAG TPA_asm: hypothetical protein [Caudoviricetes sp.]